MGNSGNDERIMEDIIGRGANAFATYTYGHYSKYD
jgi:hypothetical protein